MSDLPKPRNEAFSTSRTEALEILQRITSSRTFSTAPRLCELLTYIVGRTLDNDLVSLTEQQIGINVFHRQPGFNSSEDTIVRGTARYLRQRLEKYYQTEGTDDLSRIEVPKGSYVAHFLVRPPQDRPVDPVAAQNSADNVESVPASTLLTDPHRYPADPKRWPLTAWFVTVGLLALIAVLGLALMLRRDTVVASGWGPEILWRQLFTPGRKTLIVPGDASLDAFTSFEQKKIDLFRYTQQNYHNESTARTTPANGDAVISRRSVTPMADLKFVSEFVRIPFHLNLPNEEPWIEVRYARNMSISDLRNNNLVLIGSETFNPWIELYETELDFQSHWDVVKNTYTISNKNPAHNEKAEYFYDPKARPTNGAMTIVAFMNNTQGEGRVLIIQGTSMGATYGALNFLTDEHLWKPAIDKATDRSGRLHGFEVLLSNDFLHGGVSNTRLLTLHVH